jgi:uncharacterized protein (TIGR03790 family)
MSFSHHGRALARTLFCIAVWTSTLIAQPLNERVLVVYNAANADSAAVAEYYRSARSIPQANLCATNPPAIVYLTEAQFNATLKPQIRACLDNVGRQKVLYIVMAYATPFALSTSVRGFAIDSVVADIFDEVATGFVPSPFAPDTPHPYFANAQSQGNVYVPFQSFAQWRAAAGAKTIYSVWRLDGPTAALARGLVDNTRQAEQNGLNGIACFDRNRGNLANAFDFGYHSGDFDLTKAAEFARQAGFITIEDANAAEFGTAPAPPRCDGAVIYGGWYSLNRYSDAFSWNPGAFGVHYDSASAQNPRTGTNWTTNAIQRGITMTSGATHEPFLTGLVHFDGFFRNLLEGANMGDAMLRNTAWLRWMNLNSGDPLYRPFPGGRAPFNSPRNANALYVSNPIILGGGSANGIVRIDAPAPASGAVVSLTNSNPRATTPASVTIPPGQTSASFPIATTLPATDISGLVRATYGGVTRTNSLMVVQYLDGVVALPSTATGGTTITGKIFLNGPAPTGGISIALESNNTAVQVPVAVALAAGQTTADFPIRTKPVASAVTATITAINGPAETTETVTVSAPVISALVLNPIKVPGGGTGTGTVTLTGPAPAGGTPVALVSTSAVARVPASITVPAGARSASFPFTTTAVNTTTTAQIRATAGVTKYTNLIVQAFLATLNANTATAMTSQTINLTVTLTDPAGAGGASVTLSSSNQSLAKPPASVVIAAGLKTVTVPVVIGSVTVPGTVRFTATASGSSRTADLSVVPVLISSVAVTTPIKGGATGSVTVNLAAVAPAGGITVNLSSNNAVVSTPPSAFIPAGTKSGRVTITTQTVTTSTAVTMQAAGPYNTVSRVISVNP